MYPIAAFFRGLGLSLLSIIAGSVAIAKETSKFVGPTPVIFDTDIGTDIDDAYALALIMRSPELKLLGVTTVSGDAVARARLAAKLLAIPAGNFAEVPVYAGTSTAPQYMAQCGWAKGFTSTALHESGGVAFLREQIEAHPGEITIIAVGELTNLGALLDSAPGIAKKIKAISLMGGALRHGYDPAKPPEPEWNIRCNATAAQKVFASGVPVFVAPLDSTAALKLTPEWKVRIFAQGSPLNDALAALDFIWKHTNPWKGDNPTLFDELAVALIARPGLAPVTPLHVVVEADGLTREIAGQQPNAQVALTSEPNAFLEYFTTQLAR